MNKKRFGISIRRDIADILDNLAEYLSLSRSTIVEKAIENYINTHLHYKEQHACKSILIIVSESSEKRSDFNRVVEMYRSIVKNTTHYHADDKCIVVMYMEGQSDRIMNAYRDAVEGKTHLATILVPLCGTFSNSIR